jgi:hypothetical protein
VQLAASQEGLSSMELVYIIYEINEGFRECGNLKGMFNW